LRFCHDTGTLHLQKVNEDKVQKLQHRFYEQLARRDVAEVIRFVNEQCHFSSAFTHIQPRYVKMAVDKKSLIATIIAQGLNNGNLEMADICDIPYTNLLDIYQSRLRLATLNRACEMLIEDIANMSIFPFYTLDLSILYGSVDGQKFAVERPNVKARYSKKYYAKGKGVVAYTMLCNHLPLQVDLLGPHEHESYYAFDILYNNTTSIGPEVLTGDMHIINKLNFAFMDWFGKTLYSRFCSIQRQVAHLYCSKDVSEYKNDGALVLPAGQIDRQLIEEEWHNTLPIIEAVGVKEMSQSTLIRKLCTTKNSRTRRAMLEYDKLIRSIATLKYIQDRKLQKDIHSSQNRIESYHQLRASIATAYGKKHLIGKNEKEIAISNQCGRLIALCILHYNSSILSRIYDKYNVQNHQKVLNFIKKISPAAWRHIHFQGHFIFAADGSVIDLDEVIRDLVVANQDEESLIRDGLKLLTAAP
ncbi:MAG: transposase, partial [Gammaproteobacteria bacterium]|nr:transposase [Gammaproteobacteria bacterium]